MAQDKLKRFAAIKQFNNVFEYPENAKGSWKNYFQNTNPIVLELACGKGEYTIQLAKMHPSINTIGVDVKGNRIFVGAKTALTENLGNVAFIRSQIEMIPNYFDKNEVSDIWITFPDPQLRWSKLKKRLTHPRFLRLYQTILAASGTIHLKTDSPQLYAFTKAVINLYELELVADCADVYNTPNQPEEVTDIVTHYQKLDIAQSNKIHYLRFRIDKPLPLELDAVLKTQQHEAECN